MYKTYMTIKGDNFPRSFPDDLESLYCPQATYIPDYLPDYLLHLMVGNVEYIHKPLPSKLKHLVCNAVTIIDTKLPDTLEHLHCHQLKKLPPLNPASLISLHCDNVEEFEYILHEFENLKFLRCINYEGVITNVPDNLQTLYCNKLDYSAFNRRSDLRILWYKEMYVKYYSSGLSNNAILPYWLPSKLTKLSCFSEHSLIDSYQLERLKDPGLSELYLPNTRYIEAIFPSSLKLLVCNKNTVIANPIPETVKLKRLDHNKDF